MKKPKYIFIIICVLFIFFLSTNAITKPIEEKLTPVGIGCDVQYIGKNQVKYIVPFCIYVFEQNKIQKQILTGEEYTMGGTREDRQMKSNKNFLLGSEKVYVFSEKACYLGLRPPIDILFTNPQINDTGEALVSEGSTYDLLNKDVVGYNSSSDFLEGLIKDSHEYNFFPKNYTMMNLYEQISSEGMNCSLPYVEIKNGEIQITGVALFSNDKMVSKIDVNQSKVMYMLKEPISSGIISENENPDKYIDLVTKVKQKRRCKKIGDKYFFNIDLEVSCDILSNEEYKNLATDTKSQEKLKKDIEASITKQCNTFITKMKSEIKLDCLDLGRLAASKYGRHTGTDWNKTVCNSDINVNVKVSIDKLGRNDY